MSAETKEKMGTDRYSAVLNELFGICVDAANKPADRISAAKLLLDYIRESNESDDIRVVFENINEALLE